MKLTLGDFLPQELNISNLNAMDFSKGKSRNLEIGEN